jgi:hypothetical protein
MASLPVEVLLGIYLGLLVGIIPALVSWGLAFTFRYFAGVTIPSFGVAVLAIALAGINGGLLAIADKAITQAPNPERVVTAIIVVTMASMYAHAKGDEMGASFPRRLSLDSLRERTLSTEVIELVGGNREARVRVVGEVADMEGYPPLPEETRAAIRGEEWTFPADLRLSELESRLEERLQTEYDLGDVAVTIDPQGRASVIAAPPFSGLSKRVEDGRHAVSVDAILPTGLGRGDEVTLITPDTQTRGTVISATTGGDEEPDHPASALLPDDETDPAPSAAVRAPTTTGGEGRITVAVHRTDAQPLLRASTAKVVVEPRGTRREYELISLLRRRDHRFRKLTIGPDGPLDGVAFGDLSVRADHDVAIFAVRTEDGWDLSPETETTLLAGTTLYAVGTRESLAAFEEVAT